MDWIDVLGLRQDTWDVQVVRISQCLVDPRLQHFVGNGRALLFQLVLQLHVV